MFSIEERIQAQQAVLTNEREVRLLLESVPIMIWCAAANGEISYINKHLAEYHGVGLIDVQRNKYALIHPDDRPGAHDDWTRCVTEGRPFARVLRTRRCDGAYRWQQVSAEPLRDSDCTVVSWYGMQVDIHEAKTSEERLRRLESGLSKAARRSTAAQLAASIAHEINQPLAAIVADAQACVRWLSARSADIERVTAIAERIAQHGQFASAVVGRVRSIFRQAPPELRCTDINETIEDVLLMLDGEFEASGVRVDVDLQVHLPGVLADKVQLQQVLVNILHNAVEAMAHKPPGDRVVSVRSSRSTWSGILIEVADCGDGVPDPDRIFEPFFSTKDRGMGIGLAVCHSVVEAHSGRLWVEENASGGATFFVSLPVADDRAARQGDQP